MFNFLLMQNLYCLALYLKNNNKNSWQYT